MDKPVTPYDQLPKVDANYVPLSPLSFIERTATVFPDRAAVIHGKRQYSWAETYARCRRLASALTHVGIGKGDTVAAMLANTPEMYEAHFGVPMTGAVLNTLNIRLDAQMIAFILDHGDAKVLLTDREYSPTVKEALSQCSVNPTVINVDDVQAHGGELLSNVDYEDFLANGDPDYQWTLPGDEWDSITLNYTSGTTGNPKGVVYHHRGAYLNALGNGMAWDLNSHPIYLWSLPMFHCNGWCYPWTTAAYAGTNVCLRSVNAKNIYDAIENEGVDHFCGAPIVLGMVVNATEEEKRDLKHPVYVMTAGAPPPEAVLENIENEGFVVTHVYGLTETYGPATVCAWQDDWASLDPAGKAERKSRQGVPYVVLDQLDVRDPETMEPVPADGETMGEVMFRGNNVMKGYLKNPDATKESFSDGWFHSGDLGVRHSDGYVELKDRSKDIIISGGENISSIEVEEVLYRHPAVLHAAVVAKSDDKWGETPCAFVELKEGAETPSEEDVIGYCRENLAHYKCPKFVRFVELPKTSTGKITKFKLRELAEQI